MKIILITGGSFQGKSLIAFEVGYYFNIPAIICTDTIRNIMHIQFPEDPRFFTSTYLMTPDNLSKQMRAISEILVGVVEIFEKRGESVILEGMHFDEEFIEYLVGKSNALLSCLDNKLPFEEKILLKGRIRSQIEYLNPETNEIQYDRIGAEKINQTPYMLHAERIIEIHETITSNFRRRNLQVIEFYEIEQAKRRIKDFIKKNLDS